MEDDEYDLEGIATGGNESRFRQAVVSRTRHRYVDSFLTPESDVEKTVGQTFLEMMSESEALASITKDLLDATDDDGPEVSEDDDSEPIEVEEVDIVNPELISKGRVRSLRTKIKDLRNRWQELDLSAVEAEDVIAEIDLDSVIEAEEQGYGADIEDVEISQEEVEETLNWHISSGIFEEYSQVMYNHKLRDYTATFYILYQTIVEEETIKCLNKEIISERYKGTNGTFSFLEELSQPVREELLERTESIEPHIVSMMVENRRLRNNLVHSLHGADEYEYVERAAAEVDRCRDVLAKFDEDDDFSWGG